MSADPNSGQHAFLYDLRGAMVWLVAKITYNLNHARIVMTVDVIIVDGGDDDDDWWLEGFYSASDR